MATALEDLRVLQAAEKLADDLWNLTITWGEFARDTLGKQLVRAVDSIGANIAESFGRYNFGEKLQFLYYARGSLFETKYWLNRAMKRGLSLPDQHGHYSSQLVVIGQQLNAFAASLKSQRRESASGSKHTFGEEPAQYVAAFPEFAVKPLLTEQDLLWLSSLVEIDTEGSNAHSPLANLQSLISNL